MMNGFTMSSKQHSSRDISQKGKRLNQKTFIKVGEIEVNDKSVQNDTREEERSERAETENIVQMLQTSECVSGYNQGQNEDGGK